MRRVISLAVSLALLGAVLVAVDRVAASFAAGQVAAAIQRSERLAQEPEVHVEGFPFLTQALRGSYRQVDVTVLGLSRGDLRVSRLDAQVTGVDLPLSEVLDGRVGAVPARMVTATALLAYADLDRVARGLRLGPAQGGLVRVTGSLTVLGVRLSASADSEVRLTGPRTVTLTARRVVLGDGRTLVGAVLTRLIGGRLDLRITLPELPFGLAVSGLVARGDGVAVTARAQDVVLGNPGGTARRSPG